MLPLRTAPKDAKGPEVVPIRKVLIETDRVDALDIRNLNSHVDELIVESDYNNDMRDQSLEKDKREHKPVADSLDKE